MGDFNDRRTTWDSNHVLSDLKNDFHDLVNMTDMVQLINEPTHFVPNDEGGFTESLLDLIITDSPGYVNSFELLPPLGSKHATLYMEFKVKYPRDKCYMRHVWDYEKGNYNLLNMAIARHPWENVMENEYNLDSKTAVWTSTFLELCRENIPNREICVRPKDLPWITTECKRLIRARDRAFKKFQRTKGTVDGHIWKTKARKVRLKLNISRLNFRLRMKETEQPWSCPQKVLVTYKTCLWK
jgi:hypothetical protein